MTNNKHTRRLDFIFRVTFLLVYATTLFIPAQAIQAAPSAPKAEIKELPEVFQPAPGGYSVASQENFQGAEYAAAASGPITADGSSVKENVNPLSGVFAPLAYAPPSDHSFSGGLTIEPIAAYNLIVDSNVLSPSSYGPNAATLGAKFCNTSGSAMNDVWVYIGDYDPVTPANSTPGVYPQLNPTTYTNYDTNYATFAEEFPHLDGGTPDKYDNTTTTDYGDTGRIYALEHEAGSVTDQNDASRYLGDLAAGECRTQYWLVSYPRKAMINGGWVDVTGGIKPNDDLWLPYDFWATSGATTSYYSRFLTMRNEISAMANKIWPNTDSKVPDQYLDAIAEVLGWDTWVEGGGTTAFPGQTAVSQGIWYDFGNVGAGFDNNYDLVPDRNAWVQPIGDATSYDPGCFRLVRTYGIIIVKLNDGTELLIPFVDQMYFENLPANNTGAVGLVYYEYMALDGACSAGLTPYQEVASGYDNEKFNADFGAGIPPLQSQQSIMTFDKTDAPSPTNPNAQVTYTLAYTNVDPDGAGGMSISVGAPTVGSPFVVQDKIPAGTCYVAGTAAGVAPTYPNNLLVDGTQTPSAYTVFYSTDTNPADGIVWTLAEPGDTTPADGCNDATYLRWVRNDVVENGSTGQVQFKVFVPSDYVTINNTNVIENTGCLKLGEGPCFKEDTTTTLVAGNSSINGTVWKDDKNTTGVLGNALQDGDEQGIVDGADTDSTGVTVKLYWDANGDGDYSDAGDFLLAETTTMNYTVASGRVQLSGSNVTTTSPLTGGINIIGGLVDVNGDGLADGNDDGFFGGYPVLNGFINPDNDAVTGEATDNGTLVGAYNFGRLPATTTTVGQPKYLVAVDTLDGDIPTGYGPTTPTSYTKIAVAAGANYGDATDGSEPSDFGFAPALALEKFITPTSYYEGDTLSYTIKVTNTLPGGDRSGSTCKYTLWTQYNPPDGTPATLTGVKAWQNPTYLLGAPDERLSTTNMADANDEIGLSGFNLGPMNGNPTRVYFFFNLHETREMDSAAPGYDQLFVDIYYNNSQRTRYAYDGTGAVTPTWRDAGSAPRPAVVDNDVFGQPYGAEYSVTQEIDLQDVAGAARTAWAWSDFTANMLEAHLVSDKAGGTGDVGVDSFGFIIETDGTCGGDATTLNPAPLTDIYDSDHLTFVSADPPISSQSAPDGSGNVTLSWSNVGPLYAGETKLITVNFTAKATTPTNTTNTATSAGTKFATGLPANSPVTDTETVTISALGSIAGRIWNQVTGGTAGWSGATGYDLTHDTFIPGVGVQLYACYTANPASGGVLVDNPTKNTTCANNGGWYAVPGMTAVTDATGSYKFDNLRPGYYYVQVTSSNIGTQVAEPVQTLAAGGQSCTGAACDLIWQPDVNTITTEILTATTGTPTDSNFNYLTAGEDIINVNWGFTSNIRISGNVWEDYNGDGTRATTTPADPGIASVTVTLTDCGADLDCATAGDNATYTVATDANGNYQFINGVGGVTITPGRTYQVSVNTGTLPSGPTWTETDEDKNYVNDSINNAVTITGVTANAVYPGNNFGYHRSGSNSIGDTVFYDWDGDALQDTTLAAGGVDENMPNITVNLYKDLDGDGAYDTTDPLIATTSTFAYKVVDGKIDVNHDGVVDSNDDGTVGGYTVTDGVFTTGTSYLGVKIINGLLDIDGDSSTNDGSGVDGGDDIEAGQYRFNYLYADADGEKYIVRVDTGDSDFPTNVAETKDPGESGVCVACDSTNGVTLDTDISSGNNFDQDFGYKPSGSGSIGDYVWVDADGDGVKDSAELGLSGVKVILQADLNGDGVWVAIEETTTASNGSYLFSNLPVGSQYNYRVILELDSANNAIIPDDTYGNQYTNSTGTWVDAGTDYIKSANITLTSAAPNYLNADFGFAPPAAIGDTVYYDVNGNGTQDYSDPGINGVTVSLYTYIDANSNGRYDPGEDFFTDTNGNGFWDVGETSDPVAANVTAVATTTTAYDADSDKDGIYRFTGLDPNPAGYGYAVVVTPPTGATLTGDPNADGVSCIVDPDPYTGFDAICDDTDGMRLYPGTNYTGADFGYQLPGAFGDQLWIDTDGDGKLDIGESPIPNVTITASYIVAAGTTVTVNGVTYIAGQTVALTTDTDVNGNYSFQGITITGINNVAWTVTVDAGDLPAGLSNTYDPDGGNNNSTTVTMNPSGTIIQVGSLLDGDDDSDASDPLYLDADFGYRFIGNTNISGTICLETTVNGVCGTSDTDPNGIGAGEIAYDNVTVYLYRLVDNLGGTTGQYDPGIDDVVLAGVTNTAANGDYSFSNVANGMYYIIAIGAPQSGIELTSDDSTVNSGGDGTYTVQYEETKTADGVTTLSAFQVVDATAPGGVTITDRDFAFEAPVQYDYGDLPSIFGMTSVGEDGARHVITPSLYLGPVSGGAPDADADGYPSVSATSDDNVGSVDDENGATFPTNWTNSTATGNTVFNYATHGGGSITVEVQGSGYLLAWIDINGDGEFSSYDRNGDGDYNDYLDSNSDGDAKDGGEWYEYNEFIINQAVSTGTGSYTFQIPYGTLNATTATTFNIRFRLFDEMPLVPSLAYKGAADAGEVEDYQINVLLSAPPTQTPHTTPVTLSYFRAQRAGSKIEFNWATATETGNAGFNLYVESLGQLVKINKELIPSAVIDSLETQEYAFSADMAGYIFYIEDVDVFGEGRKYGPFRADQTYGSELDAEKIDQLSIRQEYDSMAALRESRMRPAMRLSASALRSPILSRSVASQLTNTLNLKVTETGLHRVTYEQLRDAGLDLLRVPVAKITLSNRGKYIPALVSAPNTGRMRGLFGPGGYIEFYGLALDTLYTDANIYTVQVLNTAAVRPPTARTVVSPRVPVETSFTETLTVNNQNRYAYFAPGKDVWYDKAMSVAKGSPNSWDWTFDVVHMADGAQSLEVTLWGVNDTPSLTPDHSVVILVNGAEVAREKFNGLMEKVVKVNLPAGLLKEGANTLRVTMPADTRAPSDLIALDKFSVTYQRSYRAVDDQLTFTSSGKSFAVTDLTSRNVVVYRVDNRGATLLSGVKITASGGGYTVSFGGTGKPTTYIVAAANTLPAPEMQATRLAVNLNQPAQYLIIAHPHFIDGLQPLIAAKQAQGFTVSVVDVYDLYQQYNYGIFDPSAIKAYIAYAAQNLGTKYVLLVGGDTYDYRNYLQNGSISFIPSLYVATGSQYAQFVPVDPLYADVDNDNAPDLAIGRFPVRTRAELDLMIQKTLAYAAKDYGGTAVFASDKFDGSASFKQIANGMAAGLPDGWTTAMIHLDDTDATAARAQLIDAMNNGTALVTYAGHSAAQSWTFSGLFNMTHAKNLTNAGRPFVVVQWGCWNTYYVDPVNEYMVQSFLFAGDNGAAAVLGAVTLTDSTSERKLGELLTPRMATPGMTIGQALLDAKKELAKTDPKLIDVLLGWTLMGDPAMVVQP